MLITIHPENPEKRKIAQIIEIIKDGGLVIYPTDTIYGLGCDISNAKAVERICKIKGITPAKANLSFICSDLSNISEYCKPFSSTVYKIMRKCLPGPYTFILNASSTVPKMLKNNKKTVGIRVPNSPIVRDLVDGLGMPLMSTSLNNSNDTILDYYTDPYEIYEEFKNLVDVVIDGGYGNNIPSTIIDCTDDEPVLIREGAGEFPV